MRVLSVLSTFLFCSMGMTVHAQYSKMKYRNRLGDSTIIVNTAVKPPKVKPPKMLRSELSIGYQLSTNGWGVPIEFGKYFGMDQWGNKPEMFSNVHLIQLEIGEIHHPKEYKSTSTFLGISVFDNSYTFGKINNLYKVKLGYGQRRMLAGKAEKNAISLHWVGVGGFIAGLLKPYYMDLTGVGLVKYSKDNEQLYLSTGAIQGKGGFAKGFDEIDFIPGFYLKTGLRCDFANSRKFVFALEAGVDGEYYTKPIQLMAEQDAQKMFGNFYLSLSVGKKW